MTAPLLGYPTKWANKNVEAIDFAGPDPYVVGGVPLAASDFGWGGFDSGYGSVSQSGTYFAMIRFSADGAQRTAKVLVFVSATGAEAGAIDLSAESFRLNLVGV